ncbi:MAG: hypothetical protein V2A34_01175, partial [Lentisphaerota bacterium]
NELCAELEKPIPSLHVVEVWSRLQACGEKLPAELEDKARKVVRKIQRHRRTMRKLAVLGAAIVGVIVGTAVSSTVLRWQRQQVQDRFLDQLDHQWVTCSPEQYADSIDFVSHHHPFLLKREVFRNNAGRFTRFEDIWRARQTSFEQRVKAFEQVLNESSSWDTEVLLRRRKEVDQLVQDATASLNLLEPGIAVDRLRMTVDQWGRQVPPEWRVSASSLIAWAESPRMTRADFSTLLERWESYKAERQGRIDAAFLALFEQAEVTLASVNREIDVPQVMLAPRQLLDQASEMQGVSSNLLVRLAELKAKADEIDADILRRRQLRLAIEGARTLPEYLAAMQNYQVAFPEHQFCKLLQPLLEKRDFYSSILAPDLATNVAALYRARVEFKAWEDARVKAAPAVQAKLKSLGNEKRLTDLRTFQYGRWQNGSFQIRPGFLEGEFSVPESGRRGGLVTAGTRPVVEGKCYFPRGNDVEPDFQFATFNRALGDLISKPDLMPHCRFVEGLMGVARTASGRDFIPDLYLARAADQLARMEEVPPLLRLRLLQFLVEQLVLAAPEGGREIWVEFLEVAGRIGGEINWLCSENREVKVANNHADAMIRRYFIQMETARRYVYYVSTLRDAARCVPVWSGYADWTENDPQPVIVLETEVHELWVFRPDAQSSAAGAAWIVAAIRENNRWKRLVPLRPGEPLYSSGQPTATCDTLDQLRREAKLSPYTPPPPIKGWPSVDCDPRDP